eukprot:TRINITY_DN55965_c0_g1_i1.p1 TRINITY_DN55965_c0_g1~~TRINITY_DN55965_c0_g1_i1.p1  ORF type:complete len:636 (-),score=100.14 TRINITY_DN55965_c0_g1_i1:350-2257(-)
MALQHMVNPSPLWAVVLICSSIPAWSNFLRAGEVSKDFVETKLMAEVVGRLRSGSTADSGRLAQLEADLRLTFVALPKDADGFLGRNVVRYALHRLLVHRHGWFIKGLEPDRDGRISSSPEHSKEWVPDHLQEVLERRKRGQGYDLNDLIALAATLMDLVHKEAVGRLEEVYRVLDIAMNDSLLPEVADRVLDSYLIVYLQGGRTNATTSVDFSKYKHIFEEKYAGWSEVRAWMSKIRDNVTQSMAVSSAAGDSKLALDFHWASRIVEAIGARFGEFNDLECSDLKKTLLNIEDRRPGRVLLSSFYKTALHSHWTFTEKIDYLRSLGALDETDPAAPSVIVPNYIGSRPQCLESSAFYAVCCRNECEDLMLRLERELVEPFSHPERIAELVAQLSSDTVTAPRNLSESLRWRLEQVAAANGGRVPLHGRLFAQWMHHAFPRECPFPHQAGSTSPQTPDEWMKGTGQESSTASEEEMVCHVSGPCAGGAEARLGQVNSALDPEELPWSEAEELFGGMALKTPSSSILNAFNRALRMVGFSSVSLGLALVSRHAFPKASCKGTSKFGYRSNWMLTMGLFLLPLAILSVDFWLDFVGTNELLVCCFCWGLAALIIAKLWAQRHLAVKGHDPFLDKQLV